MYDKRSWTFRSLEIRYYGIFPFGEERNIVLRWLHEITHKYADDPKMQMIHLENLVANIRLLLLERKQLENNIIVRARQLREEKERVG